MIDAVPVFADPLPARVSRRPAMMEMAAASLAGVAVCSFDAIKGAQA